MARKFSITTMGCRVNSYESQLVADKMQSDNWEESDSHTDSDVHIVNTCTVTREADRQARQHIRRVHRDNPNAKIVVTGCYSEMNADESVRLPGVYKRVTNAEKLDISNTLQEVVSDSAEIELPLTNIDLVRTQTRTRAFLQIQQGCDNGCTFCIIHVARGKNTSQSIGSIVDKARKFVSAGYREIVICGIDLGAWGEDLPNQPSLSDLLREILKIKSTDFRVRLGSVDPAHLSEELISLMASEQRICPHLHLSIQSGADLILRRMKRRYLSQDVRDKVSILRQLRPDLTVGADIMVGFPTETDSHFSETLSLIRDVNVIFPHVFSYSPREGTPAARIPVSRHVLPGTMKRRNRLVRELGMMQLGLALDAQRGRHDCVLVEGNQLAEGRYFARAANFIPVALKAHDCRQGDWVKCLYTGQSGGKMLAKQIVS